MFDVVEFFTIANDHLVFCLKVITSQLKISSA